MSGATAAERCGRPTACPRAGRSCAPRTWGHFGPGLSGEVSSRKGVDLAHRSTPITPGGDGGYGFGGGPTIVSDEDQGQVPLSLSVTL